MVRGELENREREAGLGELPEELADERGDLDFYTDFGGSAPGMGVPADMRIASDSRAQVARTGYGAPELDYTVRSVYDARPTQAYDFNVTPDGVNFGNGGGAVARFQFQVPSGYVGVLREVHVWLEPAIVIEPSTLRLTLTVDGSDVPNNLTIPMGSGLDAPVKCYVIADEFHFLGARIDGNPGAAVTGFVRLYGNLLLKDGRPAIFQPANLAGRKPVSNAVPAADIEAQAAGGGPVSGPDAEQVMREAGYKTRIRRTRQPFRNVPLLRGF